MIRFIKTVTQYTMILAVMLFIMGFESICDLYIFPFLGI